MYHLYISEFALAGAVVLTGAVSEQVNNVSELVSERAGLVVSESLETLDHERSMYAQTCDEALTLIDSLYHGEPVYMTDSEHARDARRLGHMRDDGSSSVEIIFDVTGACAVDVLSLPMCPFEDSEGLAGAPCLWDGGPNGLGDSFIAYPDGSVEYLD